MVRELFEKYAQCKDSQQVIQVQAEYLREPSEDEEAQDSEDEFFKNPNHQQGRSLSRNHWKDALESSEEE
jgi:hypothetical protein